MRSVVLEGKTVSDVVFFCFAKVKDVNIGKSEREVYNPL